MCIACEKPNIIPDCFSQERVTRRFRIRKTLQEFAKIHTSFKRKPVSTVVSKITFMSNILHPICICVDVQHIFSWYREENFFFSVQPSHIPSISPFHVVSYPTCTICLYVGSLTWHFTLSKGSATLLRQLLGHGADPWGALLACFCFQSPALDLNVRKIRIICQMC